MRINTILSVCLSCCFLTAGNEVVAQDTLITDNDKYEFSRIRWVGQFPMGGDVESAPGIFKKIGKFFWGKKPVILAKPVAISVKNSNEFFVIDQANGTILSYDKSKDRFVHLLKDLGKFPSLVGLCRLPNNLLAFTDSKLDKIYVIDIKRKTIRELNDELVLDQPTGITYSPSTGEIWVIETASHQVTVLDLNGKRTGKFGQRGMGEGEFNYPTSIWVDENGFAYIVDAMNYRVQIFSPEKKFVAAFGSQGDATGYFARPKGIATDSQGNIYVVDVLFNVVQVFDRSGNLLYYFGGQGRGKGQFWMPAGLFIDEENNIYVADSYNSRIQIFQVINND